MTYKTTYKHIRPRLEQAMTELAQALGEGVLWEREDDEYGFVLHLPGADVSLMLEDAAEYEGEEGEGWGALSLMAVKDGGEIIAQVTPYNYTDEVWVRLAPSGWQELEDRLDMMILPHLLAVGEETLRRGKEVRT